jgi:hypothetical protein
MQQAPSLEAKLRLLLLPLTWGEGGEGGVSIALRNSDNAKPTVCADLLNAITKYFNPGYTHYSFVGEVAAASRRSTFFFPSKHKSSFAELSITSIQYSAKSTNDCQ